MKYGDLYRRTKIKDFGWRSKFFQIEDNDDREPCTSEYMDVANGDKIGNYLRYTNNDRIDYPEIVFSILNSGKHLSKLPRSVFANFVAEIFKADGWDVFISRNIQGEPLSLLLRKRIKFIGQITCVVLIKKRSQNVKVGTDAIRELKSIMLETDACKGILITTSSLTGSALYMMGKNSGSLFYLDYKMIKDQFRNFK